MKRRGRSFSIAVLFSTILVLAVAFAECAAAQEKKSFFAGRISFRIPNQTLLWEDIPVFADLAEQGKFLKGKHVIRVTFSDIDSLRRTRPWLQSNAVRNLLKEKKTVSDTDLLKLFDTGTEFVLSPHAPMADVEQSYRHIQACRKTVGEHFFRAAADGLLSPTSYGYSATVIVPDGILTFFLVYYDDSNFSIARLLTQYFREQDGELYWIDQEARKDLYLQLSSYSAYKNLPEPLITLREGWNQILSTLVVKCIQ